MFLFFYCLKNYFRLNFNISAFILNFSLEHFLPSTYLLSFQFHVWCCYDDYCFVTCGSCHSSTLYTNICCKSIVTAGEHNLISDTSTSSKPLHCHYVVLFMLVTNPMFCLLCQSKSMEAWGHLPKPLVYFVSLFSFVSSKERKSYAWWQKYRDNVYG